MVDRCECLCFASQLWLPYPSFCFDSTGCFWDLCVWSRVMGNKSGKLQYMLQIMTVKNNSLSLAIAISTHLKLNMITTMVPECVCISKPQSLIEVIESNSITPISSISPIDILLVTQSAQSAQSVESTLITMYCIYL